MLWPRGYGHILSGCQFIVPQSGLHLEESLVLICSVSCPLRTILRIKCHQTSEVYKVVIVFTSHYYLHTATHLDFHATTSKYLLRQNKTFIHRHAKTSQYCILTYGLLTCDVVLLTAFFCLQTLTFCHETLTVCPEIFCLVIQSVSWGSLTCWQNKRALLVNQIMVY